MNVNARVEAEQVALRNLIRGHGVIAKHLLRKAGIAVPRDEKCSAMRLTPIPWGKPDPDLGRMVLTHMVAANPPIVIPWSIHAQKIIKYLTHIKVRNAEAEDLFLLIEQRFPVAENTP